MSAMVSDAPAVLPPGSDKKSKKPREPRPKKRDRDPESIVDGNNSERKSKKARKAAAEESNVETDATIAPAVQPADDGTKKKKKKDKKRHQAAAEAEAELPVVAADAAMDVAETEPPTVKKEKKSKKSKSQPEPAPESVVETQPPADEPTKKKKKRERKSKDHEAIQAAAAEAAAVEASEAANAESDAMEIDSTPIAKKTKKSSSKSSKSTTKAIQAAFDSSSSDRTYPFYTQTVSLYLPLYPAGMTEPLEGYADQHLKLLVNRYVPDLKGILLAYRNPRLGERPGAKSLTEQSGMEDVALLESIAEYAVGFGWFTAEVDIFRPTRGAWMEGKINLQSEGFVGVICFDMFNASIEASRLPEGWRWVDLMSSGSKHTTNGSTKSADTSSEENEDDESKADEAQETEQLHQTGYWVDASGARVTGNLPFRIKNYEVGSSETHGYLSIEGTMLSEADEVAKVLDEREEARRRKKRLAGGYLQRQIKRIPDFATTKFAVAPLEQDEEDEAQRALEYKGTIAVGDDSD